MRVRYMLAASLAALTMAAPIAALTPAKTATAPAWTVDKPGSHLSFTSSLEGAKFTGQFDRWNAAIRFDPKNLAASSVSVVVDMASAHTGSSDKDGALPTGDWFDVSKYARATYRAKAFKDLGGGHYQAIGALTLRGVTRPLMLPFTLAITGNVAHMTGSASIDRHAYGVGQGQFAGADFVPFPVQLGISLTAKRG